MRGQNKITKQFPKDDGSLLVNSWFYTIQGEGPDAGRPALFVRLTNCNLKCWFCDTEFERGMWFNIGELVNEILVPAGIQYKCKLVVLTGGEPLLQNIIPFTKMANDLGMSVSVETAGTTYIEGLEKFFSYDRKHKGNIIVCSPKTPKLNEKLKPLIGALKYIIRDEEYDLDGLPSMSTQIQGKEQTIARPWPDADIPIYVQPCDEDDEKKNLKNMQIAAKIAMKFNYNLSTQIHKLYGLD